MERNYKSLKRFFTDLKKQSTRLGLFGVALLSFLVSYGQLADGPTPEPTTLSSIDDTNGERFTVFNFSINEPVGGGGGNFISFDAVTIQIGTGTISDWSGIITGAELTNTDGGVTGTSTYSGTIGASTISFTGLNDGIDEFGDVFDETIEYQLTLFFSTSISEIIDNVTLDLSVSPSDFNSTGTVAITGSASNGSPTIAVVATEFRFLQQPSNTQANSTMTPSVTVHVTDVNGNRDTDTNPGAISVNSTGTMTGDPLALSFSSGLATVPAVVHTATGTTLQLSTSGVSLLSHATSSTFDITTDNAPTIASIVRQSPMTATTSATSVTFRVTFDEPVVNVDDTDFEIAAGGASGTIGTVVANSTVEYDVPINTITDTGTGLLDLNIAGGQDIQDDGGTAFAGTVTSEETYTIDQTGPVVSSITREDTNPTNAASVVYRVTFTTSDVDAATLANTDFTLSGTATGGTEAISASITEDVAGEQFLVTVASINQEGTLELEFTGSVDDDLGNTGSTTFNAGEFYTIDTTDPVISSITLEDTNPTNAASVVYRVTFSTNDIDATTLASTDFTLSGTATGGTEAINATITEDVAGAQFLVTAQTINQDGTLELEFTGSVDDDAGNTLSTAFNTGSSYTIDQTGPVVSAITREDTNPTNATSVVYRVTFTTSDVDASTLANTDFTLSGTATGGTEAISATITEDVAGAQFLVTVQTINQDGTLELEFTGSVDDDLGNTGSTTFNSGQSYTIDQTGPVVSSITREDTNPTNAASVVYRVTFTTSDVDAATLANTDFTLSGTATGGTEAISASITEDVAGEQFLVTVASINQEGTLELEFTGSVDDDLGNTGSTTFNAGEFYTIDTTDPVISSITLEDTNPTNAASVVYRVTFSTNDIDATTLASTDFTLSGTATGGTEAINATITEDVAGAQFLVTAQTINQDGTLELEFTGSVDDDAGNTLSTAFNTGSSYTIDQTGPIVSSINREDTNPTNATSVVYRVTFTTSDVDAATLANTDFSLSGTATGGTEAISATITEDVAGAQFLVTVQTINQDGTLELEFTGSVDDDLGNIGSTTFNSGQSYTIDQTGPVVSSITREDANPTNAASVVYRVTFTTSDVDASTLANTDFTLSGTATGGTEAISATITEDVAGAQFLVTVASINQEGTLELEFTGSVDDDLGNTGSATFNSGQSYTIDMTDPVISSITLEDTNPTNATSVVYRVTFSTNDIDATTLASTDFTLTGTATGGTEAINATITEDVAGAQFLVTAQTINQEGTLELEFTGSVSDDAGNALSTIFNTGAAYTIDFTPPTVTDLEIFDTDLDGFVDRIDITFSEPIDTDNSAPPVIGDLGIAGNGLTLPDGSEIATAPTISDPAGATNLVSVTNIAVLDHLSTVENTAVGSTAIDDIDGLWVDLAGNALQPLGDDAETVTDSAAPMLRSSSPADNSTSFGPTNDLVLTFSEDIAVGPSGTRTVTLIDVTGGGSVVQTFDLTTAPSASITIGTNDITLNPTSDLTILNEYAIQVSADAVDDLAAPVNSYPGINNNDDLDFVANNTAPSSGCFNYATNYNVAAGTNNGHISRSQCNTPPAGISSIFDSPAEATSVFYFNIMNGSGTAENLNAITFRRGTGDDIDWSVALGGAELIDENGVSEAADAINSDNIVFTPNTNGGDLGDIPGDASAPNGKEYALRIWFNTNLGVEAPDIDGKDLIITLSLEDMGAEMDRIKTDAGSVYEDNQTYDLTTSVTVNVTASEYRFSQQPTTGTEANEIMTPAVTLEATDENGNRDLGYDNVTETTPATIGSGGASLAGSPTVANASDWVQGIGTVSNIIHTAGETGITLSVTAGDLNTGATSNAFNIAADMTPPSVLSVTSNLATISDSDAGIDQLQITIVYQEGLSTLLANRPNVTFNSDIIGSGTLTFKSGSSSFTTTTITNDTYIAVYDINDVGEQALDVDVSVNGGVDIALNTQTVAFNEVDEIDVDMLNPTITSIQRVTASPTNADAIAWDFTFSEAVSAVDATDFSETGTTGGVSGVVNQGGNVERVTVSGGDMASLNATVTIAADGSNNIIDANGNALNLGTTPSPNETTIIVDNTAPTLAISDTDADDLVNDGDAVTITATFTEANGLGGTPTIAIGSDIGTTNMSATADPLIWTYAWTVGSGTPSLNESAAITISVSDAAGNALGTVSGTTSITIDNTAPTLAISDNDADDLVNDGDAVTITATFTEANGLGGTPTIAIGSDIGTTNMSATADPLIWTYAWTVGSGTPSLNESAAITISVSDAAGNALGTVSGTTAITIDNTGPTLVISDTDANDLVNDGDAVTITATFTEANGLGGTPTIAIGSDIGTTNMSATADPLIWTYAWTVGSGTPSLNESAAITISVSDAVGNALGTVSGTTSITIDNTAPTLAISDNDADDLVNDGDAVTITATFTEANGLGGTPTIAIGSDIGTTNMSATADPLIWTYAWTVGSGTPSLNESAAITISVSDAAGNALGTVSGTTAITIDNTGPTLVISDTDADDLVNDGDAVTITATFTEANGLGGTPTIAIGSDIGTTNMSATADPLIWTYAWTVGSGTPSLNESAAITISVSDAAGNALGTISGTTSITIDNTGPTLVISEDDADNFVIDGNVVNITATFTEANGLGGTPTIAIGSDIGTTNMSATADPLIWTYAWTVGSGTPGLNENAAITVTVNDAAGNPIGSVSGTTSLTIDNIPPIVTVGNISIITNGSGAGVPPAFVVGDVVTVQWDNTAATGDNDPSVTSVSINFSQFGGGTAVTATNTADVWEASYTIVAGSIDLTNRNIAVSAFDGPGNNTIVSGADNETVDNEVPVVTAGFISVSGAASGPSGEYIPGDNITISWNNTGTGDNNGDIGAVNVDFTALGGGVQGATNSAETWSATYTVVSGSIDASGLSATVTALDDAGNTSGSIASPTVTVDNEEPVVTVGNISISGANGNSGEYIIGDVVSVSWNNTGGGDNNADITGVTVNFAEFGGGIVAAVNSSDTWTATYTIVDGSINNVTDRNAFVIVTDDANNVTNQEDDASVVVDNQRPSALATPDLILADDLGTSNTDDITSEAQPTFVGAAGSAVALQPVFLYSNQPAADTRVDNGTIVAAADGSWTVDIALMGMGDLTNNAVHNIEYTTFDAAGNESLRSTALVFEHVTPPVINSSQWLDSDLDGDIDQLEITFDKPVDIVDVEAGNLFTALTFSGGTITFNGDLTLSNQTTVTLDLNPVTGTASPGDVVTYATASASSIISNNGGIEITNGENDTPTDGANPVIINSISLDTDSDGNTDEFEIQLSEAVNDGAYSAGDFDVTSPNGTEVLDNFFTDVDDLATDADSNDEYIRFTFSGGAGATATGTGVFDLTYNNTTVQDANSNPLLITNEVLVDGAVPRVDLATGLSPADNEPAFAPSNTLTLTYSEDVLPITGRDITVVQVVPPANYILDAENVAEVSITGSTVTLTLPGGSITNGKDYYVFMDAGSFEDAANNLSADQFNSSTDWNFTTSNALVVSTTSANGVIGINLNLNDVITSIGTPTPSDFTVTDGIGTTFTVDALVDLGSTLELSFDDNGVTPDLTTAAGDLTVTFDGSVGGGGATTVTASFGILDDFMNLPVNFDTSDPSISSAVVNSDSQIGLSFGGEPVQLTGPNTTDFMVVDGFGNTYNVTGIVDGTANDDIILLNFGGGGLNTPTGDIQITYTNAGGISDFGGNQSISQVVSIDADITAPSVLTVTDVSNTQLDLNFNEIVQITQASPATDFNLVDGGGNNVIVSVISDGTTGDNVLELTTQDKSTFIGDFTLSYSTSGTSIQDYGNNSLGNFVGVSSIMIDADNTSPTISSATRISDTQIDIEFSEAIQVTGIAGFTFTDEAGNPLNGLITGFTDVTAQDEVFEVSFSSLSSAIGDILVNYSNAGSEVNDFGGNTASTGSVSIDLDFTLSPSFAENGAAITDLPHSLLPDGNIAFYRSNVDRSAETPITITPTITNGTSDILIYGYDNSTGMLVQVASSTGVTGAYTPTVGDLMVTPVVDALWDWTNADNTGVFTFFISEVANNSTPSESPLVQYSLALMDVTNNDAGTQDFSQADEIGANIGFASRGNQTYTISGNGLTAINNTAVSARFVPLAAGGGAHQISVQLESDFSGVSTEFRPTEFRMRVTSISDVFENNNANIYFGKSGTTELEINPSPSSVDVGDALPIDTSDPDFHDIEVYHVFQGNPNLTIGAPGIAVPAGGNIGGGETAGSVLTYDPNGSIADPINSADGIPTYTGQSATEREWELNSALAQTYIGARSQEVDTLRFVTFSKADGGGGLSIMGNQEVYLFPDPTVTFSNLSSSYCEDESSVNIQVDIFTYTNTAFTSGGIDLSNQNIPNGYRLYYNPSTDFSTDPGAYTLIADSTATGSVGVVNSFTPSRVNEIANVAAGKAAGVGAGWYQIEYTSEPQTLANLTSTITQTFYVVPILAGPELMTTAPNAITAGTDGTKYVFEYCSGVTIDDLEIDVALVASDADGPDTEYFWYRENGASLNAVGSPTLAASDFLASNPVFGTLTQNLYVTRVKDGCESDSTFIEIRIFDEPDSPTVSTTDTNNHPRFDGLGFYDNINEVSGEYFFEYCAQVSDNTIAFDILTMASGLEDPFNRASVEARSYFAIYSDEAGTTLIDTLEYNASGYSIDFVSKLGLTNVPSNVVNDNVISEFWIQKVVADTTIYDASPMFDGGCRTPTTPVNELTKVTVAMYTYPEIPSDFTGNPRRDGNTGEINYYMCQGEDFPDMGVDPPDVPLNDTRFEWFANSGLTDQITTSNIRGEVVTQTDLVTHAGTSANNNFDPNTAGVHTFYVRLVTNVNSNSGFVGCESDFQIVNLIVYPSADSATPLTVTEGATGEFLRTDLTDIDNFDFEYNFCVPGGSGLNSLTTIASDIVYSGAPTVTNAMTGGGVPEEGSEVLWFLANGTGDQIANSNPVAAVTSDDSYTVTASDLQIEGSENTEFNFAVVHRSDFIDGYNGFDGCFSDTTFVKIVVSTTPEPAFTFSGITVGELTTFDFIDPNSVGADVAVDFQVVNVASGGTETSFTNAGLDISLSNADFTHSFSTAGQFDATLTITSEAGCISVITRRFQILDKIQVSGSYFESFDGNNGGWFAEFQDDSGESGSLDNPIRVSSWTHGFPSGNNVISTTRSGVGAAWTTTGTAIGAGPNAVNNYVGGEISYVYSPAFDISSLVNPAVRFSTSRDIDGTKDGVVFQYSTDDGLSWNTLGGFDINAPTPSSGQNWYNESAISSGPGDESVGGGTNFNSDGVGWAGQYSPDELIDNELVNGWFESTHRLEGLAAGSDNIRFRFALSSSGSIADRKDGDGFGFDDMQIFQLGKNVLIEQFSSTLNEASVLIGQQVNVLGAGELMINYFTDVYNTQEEFDLINQRNPTGPGARRALYGISDVPTTVLDGEVINPETIQNQIVGTGWDDNDLTIKGLAPAPFTMPMGNQVNEFGVVQNASDAGTISVTAQFVSQADTVDRDYSFIFAVIETTVDAAEFEIYSNRGIAQIRNVLRILLPTPAGFIYNGDLTTGQVIEHSIEWDIDNVYDPNNLRVIAFAQDNETNAILQAGWVDIQNAAETILGISGVSDFDLYPNPADKEVTVEFEEAISDDTDWILFDQLGREIYKGELKTGTKSLNIETSDIPSGLYFFQLYRGEEKARSRRIIVTH